MAVFDYHKKKGYADMYSLHSWCGSSVFALYFIQVSLVPASKGWERRGWDSGATKGPIRQGACPEEKRALLSTCQLPEATG